VRRYVYTCLIYGCVIVACVVLLLLSLQCDSRAQAFEVVSKPTKPFEGQKTGTSGLRKKTKVFMQENYLANWIQSLFLSLGDEAKGTTMGLGGDGRYFNKEAVQIILKLAAGLFSASSKTHSRSLQFHSSQHARNDRKMLETRAIPQRASLPLPVCTCSSKGSHRC
jgi:hypothetical protein